MIFRLSKNYVSRLYTLSPKEDVMKRFPFFAFVATSIIISSAFSPPSFAQSEWSANGEHIYNTNAGYVGIGIMNPTHPLDIKGDESTGLRLRGKNGYLLTVIGNTKHAILHRDAARIISPSCRSVVVEIRGNDAYDRFSVITDPDFTTHPATESFVVLNSGNVRELVTNLYSLR